jgi:hypothetical protein
MYLPDPVAALRSISLLVRPGGVLAFQEPYWGPVLSHLAKQQLHLRIESLGSLDTLVHRLQAEVAESKTVACWFASVGAWCRKA